MDSFFVMFLISRFSRYPYKGLWTRSGVESFKGSAQKDSRLEIITQKLKICSHINYLQCTCSQKTWLTPSSSSDMQITYGVSRARHIDQPSSASNTLFVTIFIFYFLLPPPHKSMYHQQLLLQKLPSTPRLAQQCFSCFLQ